MGRFTRAVKLVAGLLVVGGFVGFSVGCDGGAQTEEAEVVASAVVTTPVMIDSGSNVAVGAFAADNSFKGGTPISHANTIDLSKVVGGAPAAVYQTARTGNITYTLTGFAGQVSAKVRLHFAETYFADAGKRTFDISINGAAVKSAFDIITASGGKNVAYILEKTVNTDANGTITIVFKSVVNNSLISAIEVIPPSCVAGVACAPNGNICLKGTTSCATGTATCTATGNAANGTTCGTGKVCNNGVCGTCTAGAACSPANLCHKGTLSCATGAATCVDTGANVANGTACGAGKVCANGVCAGRVNGQTCAAAADCGSGNCVDGVCCSTASCGTCMACNVNGAGTCAAAPAGATLACPNSAANCSAGCDGFGKCIAANAGTNCVAPTCTQSDSLGGVAHVGVYTSVSYKTSTCDGSAAGAGACKARADAGCGNYVCQSGSACKTSCTGDVDCRNGNRCVNGSCVPKLDQGALCTANAQCAVGGCAQREFGQDPAPICHECSEDAHCPTNLPVCLSDSWRCVGCGIGDPANCNADGSDDCTKIGSRSSGARDCGKITAKHRSCGNLDGCPSWMVCLNSTCKVAGAHPCVKSSDCASGVCQGGVCSQTPFGGYCVGHLANECASGTCQTYWPNPNVFFFDGSTCQ